MMGVLLGIHILVSVALILVVLLQSGKGGGLAGAFGGGGGVGAVFGGQTAADFLTKATRYLAIGFMLTSLVLALTTRGRTMGTLEEALERRAATPAAAVGDEVPPPEIPADLPGAVEEGTEVSEEAPAPADEAATDPATQ
jgi:preprotein translocase subunit SecG